MTVEADRITAVTQITTHARDGIALLARQFRGKPLIEALINSYLLEVQAAENALWALLVDTTLDTAAGDALDQLGRILVFPRGTLDDDDYRVALKTLVRARMSSGTGPDIQAVVAIALGVIAYTYSEGYASVLIEPRAPLPFAGSVLMEILRITKAGGVQIELIDPPAAETLLFTCSTSAFFVEIDAARGFSDVTQVAGGRLTGALS